MKRLFKSAKNLCRMKPGLKVEAYGKRPNLDRNFASRLDRQTALHDRM